MGWYYSEQSRKELVQELTKSWERTINGVTVRSTTLKHCIRGNAYRGALWAVHERTFSDGRPDERWICCYLLSCDNGQWGYKPIEECMGPLYYSCPLSYLNMTPVADAEWRGMVKEHHAQSLRKRRAKKRLRDLANA